MSVMVGAGAIIPGMIPGITEAGVIIPGITAVGDTIPGIMAVGVTTTLGVPGAGVASMPDGILIIMAVIMVVAIGVAIMVAIMDIITIIIPDIIPEEDVIMLMDALLL